MRLPQGLRAESEAWQRDGLITAEQRRAILARYEPAASPAQQASATLTWLAVLAAGIGASVLVAFNWTAIPPSVKVLMTAGPMLALYVAAAMAARAGRHVLAERLALLAALFAGAVLFVTEDLFHVDPQRTNTLLLWAAVLAATALLTPSALAAAVGTTVATWWTIVIAGAPPGPWWVLAIWPVLALTIERVPNRWAAGGVTIGFGVWVFFAVLSVWSDQPGIAAIGAVLAGSWIATLAREPAARRPEFARPTAALALTLLGLILLLPSASHRGTADWHLAAGPIWPAIALLTALAGGTCRNVWRSRAWRSWPAGLTALAVLWLVALFTLPVHLRASAGLQWAWTAVFSAATILMGAGAVKEAARTRDVGQLVAGLASVVIFVIVRVVDARSLALSGMMLLASAILLWWLARLWSRSAATGVVS